MTRSGRDCDDFDHRSSGAALREGLIKEWLAHSEREALKEKAREGGPSYYVVRRHRIEKALLNLVSRSIGEGLLSYTKAARLLGVKARNVDPLLSGGASSRGGRIVLYLLDANILITAANTYYGITRVPEFWSWLEHQGGAWTSKCRLR